MELLLVSAAVVSLLLAGVMSAVAWKLLRESRDRSAARVATLETLAFSDAARVDEEHEAHDVRNIDEDLEAEEDWDLALRPQHAMTGLEAGPEQEFVRREAVRPRREERARRRPRDESAVPVAGMFNEVAAPAAAPRRWIAFAAVVLVAATGSGAAYGLRGTDALSNLSLPAGLFGVSHAANATPLELLSLRHSNGAADTFTVTGLVQNPKGGRVAKGVVAVVYLFDRQGRYFATGRATLEPATLQPGEESPFVVSIADVSEVGRYRVGFRFSDGGVVAHVDRRGHEPDSTTGGGLGDPTQTVVPVAIPRGTEGE